MKDFPAGEWYPSEFLEAGKIRDAKTVTVAGAALFQDVLNGNLTGFQIADDSAELTASEFNWGVMSATRNPRDFQTAVFFNSGTPAGKRWHAELPLQSWIGRSLRLSDDMKPEPVYRLDLNPEAAASGVLPPSFNKAEALIRLALELKIKPGIGECLEIVPGSVQLLSQGQPVALDAAHLIRLRLCTLMDDAFWLDSPAFEVDVSRLFGAA